MVSCIGKNGSVVIDNVEATISTDRETMFVEHGDYEWFETTVNYKDFLDEETDGSVVSVASVFQTVTQVDSTSYRVYTFTHENGKVKVEEAEGPWLEDCVLNDVEINLTFEDAFNKLMEADIVKPHSKVCVLRKPIGPVEVNPQYIFGNAQMAVFVDAVNGNVTDIDPMLDGVEEDVTDTDTDEVEEEETEVEQP
jgi:hypothetical protein